MTNTATTAKRFAKVTLNIPYSSPIKTLDGKLHEAGQVYKFLGYWSCGFVRLSRIADSAKLIIEETRVCMAGSEAK